MDRAIQTQLANIEKRTGRTLAELIAFIKSSGLEKHGELRAMLKRDVGMGHGDANTLVHVALQSDAASAIEAAGTSIADVVDGLYAGPKAALRPVHEQVMAAAHALGDFEIAPKKTYLSLRRKRQFAMVGPATNTRVEVGLNMKGVPGTDRLLEQPSGGMCQYKVALTRAADIDDELRSRMRQAYDQAG